MALTFDSDEEAVAILQEGLRRNPQSLTLRASLVERLVDLGDFAEAERVLEKLQRDFPDAHALFLAFAIMAHAKKDWSRLEWCVEEARKRMNPAEDVNDLTKLGVLLVAAPGQATRALELLLEAARYTNHAFTHLVVSVLLEKSDPEKSEFHRHVAARHWNGPRDDFQWHEERVRRMVRDVA